MNNLAGMYEVGWGVPRDPEKAKSLYTSSALTGNTSAIENLKRLGQPVPLEAQTRAERNQRDRVRAKSSAFASAIGICELRCVASDPYAEAEILSRGDIITDVPTLDASDEEFEEWLAEQDSFEDEFPSANFEGDDPFGFLKKNWNRVNRQRRQRPQDPSDTLR